MREAKANLALNNLLKEVKKGFDAKKVVESLGALREMALEEQDPTAVKICRLASEYIAENGNMDLGYVEEEEIGDMTDMEYLLELMLHIDNDANREEIREIRDRLKGELY
ncbi:MAG: hypothetical protein JXR19_02615 [Bacteroidia bacterium]